MKGFKDPTFQDRAAASARAKKSALDQLMSAPKPNEAELAAGAARQAEREAKDASKRAAAREDKEEAERLEREKALQAKAEQAKAEPAPRTEAELKAARDARYAARKSRKSG